MGSSRLPGKVLLDLGGRPVLSWICRAASAVTGVDAVVVATSVAGGDDPIVAWCKDNGIACHRGPEADVLERFRQAATAEKADIVIRLTADCPFLDPAVVAAVVWLRQATDADYASNVDPAGYPDGLDCEVFTSAALKTAAEEAKRPTDREHVTPFIRNSRRRFRSASLPGPGPGLTKERWTLDTPSDLAFLQAVAAKLPKDRAPAWTEVMAVLAASPDLRRLNAGQGHNEGYRRSLEAEAAKPVPRRFTASQAMFQRASTRVPLASQTFSRSHIQLPGGAAPLFLTHGHGGRVWDVDGNEYVDMMSSLLSAVLGYRDPDVDQAVRDQLNRGVTLSLATELEFDLAEKLAGIIPSAEMTRFGKNGTDATSAAIRIARASTRRDHVLVGGYHGWQDWYIGQTTRNKGVPAAVGALTHGFPYNDLDAVNALFKRFPGEVAAVILEPMAATDPRPGYLEGIKEITHKNGAVLVFDEIITGFRFALGGAQSLFGVTPDLSCFGKAAANGLPLAIITGKASLMAEMTEVFLSSTFGGEALSLAAAIATIDKMIREPVIDKLWSTGQTLADGAKERIRRHGLESIITMNGKAPWMVLGFNDHPAARKEAIKTLFLKEMIQAGVLITASHNINYAHDEADVTTVLAAYDRALPVVAQELARGRLEERLDCGVIEPVFRVR